jgi:hypothetical protein
MNKIIKPLILAVAVLLGLNACNQDNERTFYDESAPAAYSFLQPVIVVELTADFNGVLHVVVARTNAAEAASVQIKFTATAAVGTIFTLATPTLSFAAGVYEATASVQFALENLASTGTRYSFSIEFADPATPVSTSGNSKTDVQASRKLTFINVGNGTFTSNDVYGETYEVEIERAEELPTLYRARDLYADNYHILIQVFPEENRAVIPQQEIGVQLFNGYLKTWLRADACTYANGVITVTPGSATNYNRWIVEPAPSTLGAWVGAPEILELPAGAY